MTNILLYMSYGRDSYHQETIFSILSAQHFSERNRDFSIVVYTDRPSEYNWLGIETRALTPSLMQEWVGEINGYPFRRKVSCILDALNHQECKLAFLDGDTFFVSSPSAIFQRIAPGQSCLHLPELRLADRRGTTGALIKDLVDSQVLRDARGEIVKMHPREMMWNSGVIGVDSSDSNKIHDSLFLIDEMWKREKRAHTLEQFALGHILSRDMLMRTDDIVFHYWHDKVRKPFLKKLPHIIDNARKMTMPAAASWAYSQRPVTPPLHKVLGVVRNVLHATGFNHRWTRTSY